MASWRQDGLYFAVLQEARALWDVLPTSSRPLLLRVEERLPIPWSSSMGSGRIGNLWLVDDHGARLAQILRNEPHEFGPTSGDFSRYGLVRFAMSEDREEVVMDYELGPSISGEIHYDIERDGPKIDLIARSGTISRDREFAIL